MHRVVVDFKLPTGATLEAVVRDFHRIVTGTVGARYRLRVLPRLDGSTQVEIVWPKSSNVDARLILVCLTLRDTMPSIFVKVLERALRSRPALMEQLARANLKALSHIAD
jgi:hypothetical protein